MLKSKIKVNVHIRYNAITQQDILFNNNVRITKLADKCLPLRHLPVINCGRQAK